MNGIVISWPQLLYLGLILVLFYVAELLLFLRKSSLNKPQNKQLQRRIEAQSEALVELRQEVESLKVRLASLQVQSPPVVPSEPSEASRDNASAYSQAIRLAQAGGDAESVALACGLSRGEADLIVALYRSNSLR